MSDHVPQQRLEQPDPARPGGPTAAAPGPVDAGAEAPRPSAARIYDYFLDGKDHVAVDRRAAARLLRVVPDARRLALANRAFLGRAVREMAAAGITQFVDLGSGLPTSPNVHEVARTVHPDVRVAYVDLDPVVLAHSRARVSIDPLTRTVAADLRDPAGLLARPEMAEFLDLSEPVGILLVAVLHFVDHDTAVRVVRDYLAPLATGSMVAISVVLREGADPAAVETLRQVYAASATPAFPRSRAEVAELFGDAELLRPGVVDITQWRARGRPGSLPVGCGVAVKR